ncbi:3-deoxy-D-manno-octulosonic acid transferase [Rhodosalinus sp. K401]|uniref:3-deoxy-D-manno-octulosonic acid transferase n=1 Tax=Rhodosalinus sp. K401 TaxID=3239195 RepID=UPI003526BAD3
MVWLHLGRHARPRGLVQLGQRIAAQRPGLALLFTSADDARPDTLPGEAIWRRVPDENSAAAEAFLAHWRPDCGIWGGGAVRPALLACAARAGVPLLMVDAEETGLSRRPVRFLPRVVPATLAFFTACFARTGAAGRRLERLGVPESEITVTGPLQEAGAALPCDLRMLERLGEALAGRPVWLAAHVQPTEMRTVLRAHRAAARLSHRLLLVLAPAERTVTPEVTAAMATAAGLSVARMRDGPPQDRTQVLVSEGPGDLGLLYRLAPVTFMGSSIETERGGEDPFAPAALGSAVIHGPNVRRHIDAYARLDAAAAALRIADADGLAAALAQLLAPDRAAAMAEAAWSVASEGAEATDRIVDLVLDTLDLGRLT